MSPLDFPLLADANVPLPVVEALRARGVDAVHVRERHLVCAPDATILTVAQAEGRVVLTQDGDFGTLAVRDGQPYTGIIYLRPGHHRVEQVLRYLDALRDPLAVVTPPFMVVVDGRGDALRVRIRRRPATERS